MPDIIVANQGTADAAAAINNALSQAATNGGGRVVLGPYRYHVVGADIVVPQGVELVGEVSPGGQRANADYRTVPCTLRMAAGRTVKVQTNGALRRLAIIREAMFGANPTNIRACLDRVAAFSGTAVTVTDAGDKRDIELEDLLILGHEQAIRADHAPRININRVRGDNKAGIWLTNCADIVRLEDVHFWPFLTGNLGFNHTELKLTHTTEDANGYVVLWFEQPHGLSTGDVISVPHRKPGTMGLGRYAISYWSTLPSPNCLVLWGVPYNADWQNHVQTWLAQNPPKENEQPRTTAPVFVSANKRGGTAFRLSGCDAPILDSCFSYAYQCGFHFEDDVMAPHVQNCHVDDKIELQDWTTRGIMVTGTSHGLHWVGGFVSSQGVAVSINSSVKVRDNHISHAMLAGWSGVTNTVEVLNRGGCTLTSCDLPGAVLYCHQLNAPGAPGGGEISVVASDTRSTSKAGDLNRITETASRLPALP